MRFIKLFAIAKVDIIRVLKCCHEILLESVSKIHNECKGHAVRLKLQ